jgi:Prenyltransferase and squalene oxidase repeat
VTVDLWLERAERYVLTHEEQWTPSANVDFETLNHLIRVWVQSERVGEHRMEVEAARAAQHEDGGWGDKRDEAESQVRTTAFCCQMLLRANRTLKDQRLSEAIERSLDFLVAQQDPDGGWTDRRWHRLDATSVSVGTLIFAAGEPYRCARYTRSLKRGMSFVAKARASDGLWYHKPTSSPIEITAHLLQKVALYDNGRGDVQRTIVGLLEQQDEEGHWDKKDVDSTCDALRSMMLAVGVPRGKELVGEVSAAADRGIAWLGSVQASDGGYGVRPERPAKVLYTCDVIDTLLKYEAFESGAGSLVGFYQ